MKNNNIYKLTFLSLLVSSFAGCNNEESSSKIIKDVDYQINVKDDYGYNLANITIDVKSESNDVIQTVTTNVQGIASLTITNEIYNLEFKNLPNGFYSNTEYTLNGEGGELSCLFNYNKEEPKIDSDLSKYTRGTYMNPVNVTYSSGDEYLSEIADPSIVKGDNGYFYIVSTNRRMIRSNDAVNWELVTENIIDTPSWGADFLGGYGYALWAPDLIKIKDKWIYYYSLSGWDNPIGIGYATADNIEGPYTDQGKLFNLNEIGVKNCIDPQPFVDDDGKVYMTIGSFQGLYLIELTEDGTACLNGVEHQKENKTLIAGYPGSWDESTYEGGYIMKRGRYYYYFASAGKCCEGQNSTYRVYVGKSVDVRGPYKDLNDNAMSMSGYSKTYGELTLWAGVGNNKDVIGPGHNSILVDDAGDWWIYYHAYSKKDDYRTRHLFMDKILWSEDNYPYVETKKPSYQVEKDGPRILIEK